MSVEDDFYRLSLIGDFCLSPLFAAKIMRAGKHDALESALLVCFASFKGQVVQDALRGPYKRIGQFVSLHLLCFAHVSAGSFVIICALV